MRALLLQVLAAVLAVVVSGLPDESSLREVDVDVRYKIPSRKVVFNRELHSSTTSGFIVTSQRSMSQIGVLLGRRAQVAQEAGTYVAKTWRKHAEENRFLLKRKVQKSPTPAATTKRKAPAPAPAPEEETPQEYEEQQQEKIIEDGGTDDLARTGQASTSSGSGTSEGDNPDAAKEGADTEGAAGSSSDKAPPEEKTIKTEAAAMAEKEAELKKEFNEESTKGYSNLLHDKMDKRARQQFKSSKLARGGALNSKCNSRCSAKAECNVRCQLSGKRYQLAVAKATYKTDNLVPLKYANNKTVVQESTGKVVTVVQGNARSYAGSVADGECNARCVAAKTRYDKARTQYQKTFHQPCQNGKIKNNANGPNGKPLSDQGNPSGDTPGEKTTIGSYGGVQNGKPLGAPGAGQINWPNWAKYNWRDCKSYENQSKTTADTNPKTHNPNAQKSYDNTPADVLEARKEEKAEAAAKKKEEQMKIVQRASSSSSSSSGGSSSSSSGDGGDTGGNDGDTGGSSGTESMFARNFLRGNA